GEALAAGLPDLLGILAEVLTEASYPSEDVVGERNRLVEDVRISRSQPSVLAQEALLRRMFGPHPYGRELPETDQVAMVTPEQVRSLHRDGVLPAGSVLVLVGDIAPAAAFDQLATALAAWGSSGTAPQAPEMPPLDPGPTVLVDRPGSVQSSIRIGGPGLGRAHPDYAALQLANMVFGGYFSSRLVENIREDKGYTYSPHSVLHHASAGSTIRIQADVANEVTAPALLEIGYELGRVATLPVRAEELENARQYAIGALALATATQSGLANILLEIATSGLDTEWLQTHPRRLAEVTVDQILEQSRRFLAPSGMVTVVLGDAIAVEPSMRTLGDVVKG
ncbi:MAG: M16 family metallopeptidase, partial [Pseudonocardiaceae bacterium]